MVSMVLRNILLSSCAQHSGRQFRGLSCGLKFGRGWPEVRTQVAQSSDMGGRRGGRGWSSIRATEGLFGASKMEGRARNIRLFMKSGPGKSEKISGKGFCGLKSRPAKGPLEKKSWLHFGGYGLKRARPCMICRGSSRVFPALIYSLDFQAWRNKTFPDRFFRGRPEFSLDNNKPSRISSYVRVAAQRSSLALALLHKAGSSAPGAKN